MFYCPENGLWECIFCTIYDSYMYYANFLKKKRQQVSQSIYPDKNFKGR